MGGYYSIGSASTWPLDEVLALAFFGGHVQERGHVPEAVSAVAERDGEAQAQTKFERPIGRRGDGRRALRQRMCWWGGAHRGSTMDTALCSLLSALCSVPSALCSLLSALRAVLGSVLGVCALGRHGRTSFFLGGGALGASSSELEPSFSSSELLPLSSGCRARRLSQAGSGACLSEAEAVEAEALERRCPLLPAGAGRPRWRSPLRRRALESRAGLGTCRGRKAEAVS